MADGAKRINGFPVALRLTTLLSTANDGAVNAMRGKREDGISALQALGASEICQREYQRKPIICGHYGSH